MMETRVALRGPGVPALALVTAVSALVSCSDTIADPGSFGFESNCDLFSPNLVSGGVGRDGIPALTNPRIDDAERGSLAYMDPEDRVLGVSVNGKARAYPLFILWHHEIMNDTLGGQAIAVTYCPLTGSGLTFDASPGGNLREFGVSGLLFENNLLLFDRESESLWPQLWTQARCGPDKGVRLRHVLNIETTWEEWTRLHPNTTVVSPITGHARQYGVYPYGRYADPDNEDVRFPSSTWDPTRPAKEKVLGVRVGTESVAYPFGLLGAPGRATVTNDVIDGQGILVTFRERSGTARGFYRAVGESVLAFEIDESTLELMVDLQTGSQWTLEGLALSGPLQGTQLEPVDDAYVVFWFAWSVFNPRTRIGG